MHPHTHTHAHTHTHTHTRRPYVHLHVRENTKRLASFAPFIMFEKLTPNKKSYYVNSTKRGPHKSNNEVDNVIEARSYRSALLATRGCCFLFMANSIRFRFNAVASLRIHNLSSVCLIQTFVDIRPLTQLPVGPLHTTSDNGC